MTIAPLCFFVLISAVTGVHATGPDEPRTCGFGLAGAPGTELPNPFTVKPEDVSDILAFIDKLAPFPSEKESEGMQHTLTRFWRLYRPDLTDEQATQRLAPFATSRYSLSVINRSSPSASVERGRLRDVWQTFLNDVRRPGDPAPDFVVIARARALTVWKKRKRIVAFLKALDPTLEDTREAEMAAIVTLHNRTLPGRLDVEGVADLPKAEAMRVLWWRYVEAINAHVDRPLRPFRQRIGPRPIYKRRPRTFAYSHEARYRR